MIVAKKNATYYLSFPAIDSTTPASYKTGLSPVDTAYSKDGAGAWTTLAITDTASEIGSTGVYEIDLTAAELNHDKVIIKFSVSGMADDAYEFDLRTKLTDDLNDLAATAIVSDGNALNTTSGALDLVTTTTTATNLTNLPTIPANWLTAAGTAADFTTEVQVGLATAASIAALNDVAATDIVSAGAITTLTGAVVNVDLVDTCTTNTDMRGTDSAATATALATAQADLDIITGASGVNLLTATQASIDAIETHTGTALPALLPAALVGGRMDSNVSAVGGSATAAANLSASALGIVPGACEGTPSTTVIQTDLAEGTDDHYIGRVVVFTSGIAAGEASDITDYTGATGTITVTAITTAPAAADTFVIV